LGVIAEDPEKGQLILGWQATLTRHSGSY